MKFRKWNERTKALIAVLAGIVLMHLIFISDAFRQTTDIDPETAGQFGDFTSGYIGTFFALFTAALLYLTLTEQRKSTEKLSFETKFLELLRLHRENVVEIEVLGTKGRAAFVEIWNGYQKAIAELSESGSQQQIDKNELLHTAFYLMFFGGRSSLFLDSAERAGISSLTWQIKYYHSPESLTRNLPSKGHHSSIGHYYRHLYQTIKFIDEQDFLSDGEKYRYARILRAQLSSQEQALLLINSITQVGKKWIENDYLHKYKLVKNIPHEFFAFRNQAAFASFPNGYFEWESYSRNPTCEKKLE